MDKVIMKLASERAVVVFVRSNCGMCHAVTSLLQGELGVNAAVHELDKDPRGRDMERELSRRLGGAAVPAVFVGGSLVGGTNRVMSLHLAGDLVPMLKNAGALWL
uniref:Glutaredoxin domain-containing protein n=1 Tax=Leersia perrieri TaxID=77586 RepID=A0A0D9XUW1_9ORYZ